MSGHEDGAFGSHIFQVDVGRVTDDGWVAGHSVRGQVGHLLRHLVRIFSRAEIGAEALVSLIEVQHHEPDQDEDAGETVAA